MEIPKDRFVLLTGVVLVAPSVIGDFKKFVLIGQQGLLLVPIVEKTSVSVMGDPPNPRVKGFDAVLFHAVEYVAYNLACKILGIVPIGQPLTAKAKDRFDVR